MRRFMIGGLVSAFAMVAVSNTSFAQDEAAADVGSDYDEVAVDEVYEENVDDAVTDDVIVDDEVIYEDEILTDEERANLGENFRSDDDDQIFWTMGGDFGPDPAEELADQAAERVLERVETSAPSKNAKSN